MMFTSARPGTEYLIASFAKLRFTNWANFFWNHSPAIFPTIRYCTRYTPVRFISWYIRTAINTLFGVFTWSRNFSTVYFFVTRHTYSNAIVNIKRNAWELCQFFDVMRVKFYTCVAAFLASIFISLVYFFAPLGKLSLKFSALCLSGVSVFVGVSIFPNPALSSTRLAAKSLIVIVSRKLSKTLFAMFYTRWATMCPTLPRTIFRSGAIFFNFVRATTDNTNFGDLCVFHTGIITQIARNNKSYVAVTIERWTQHTGKTPELIG